MADYDDHGIRFSYPDSWELETSQDGDQLTLNVVSPETSFWSITLCFDRPEASSVVEHVLNLLRDEYGELETIEENSTLGGFESVSCDVDFICLELINSAFLRAFETPEFTALVYYQGTDQELAHTRERLEEITSSVVIDASVGSRNPLGLYGL